HSPQRFLLDVAFLRCLGLAAIQDPPDRNPDEAQRCRHQERRAEAVTLHQEDDQWRGNGRTDHAAAVEDADGECAFLAREEARDSFYAARKVTALGETHPVANDAKAQAG